MWHWPVVYDADDVDGSEALQRRQLFDIGLFYWCFILSGRLASRGISEGEGMTHRRITGHIRLDGLRAAVLGCKRRNRVPPMKV